MKEIENNTKFKYIIDVTTNELYDTTKAKSLKYLVDNLANENMELRHENVMNKLLLLDIIKDLEKEADNGKPIIIRKDYVNWIKKEGYLKL